MRFLVSLAHALLVLRRDKDGSPRLGMCKRVVAPCFVLISHHRLPRLQRATDSIVTTSQVKMPL